MFVMFKPLMPKSSISAINSESVVRYTTDQQRSIQRSVGRYTFKTVIFLTLLLASFSHPSGRHVRSLPSKSRVAQVAVA